MSLKLQTANSHSICIRLFPSIMSPSWRYSDRNGPRECLNCVLMRPTCRSGAGALENVGRHKSCGIHGWGKYRYSRLPDRSRKLRPVLFRGDLSCTIVCRNKIWLLVSIFAGTRNIARYCNLYWAGIRSRYRIECGKCEGNNSLLLVNSLRLTLEIDKLFRFVPCGGKIFRRCHELG